MDAVLRTDIPGLPEPRRGKVRDVYDLGDCLLIVSTDRLSAFDVVMENGVPGKGIILNQLSLFWFERLSAIANHHIITGDDRAIANRMGADHKALHGRAILAKKAEPLKIECVARGYLTGSLYKEYLASDGLVHGFQLEPGLLDGSPLPEPIFTPATKAEEGHDQNVSIRQAEEIEDEQTVRHASDLTLRLFRAAASHVTGAGLILADTKFEFGHTDDGLLWIDEALTPDSSRYWEADQWRPGIARPGFDKQFVRDYLEESGWDKQPPGPRLPDSVIQGTLERYIEAYARITGLPSPVTGIPA
ncbi:MAG: phosphoribosylaminoimidazolesuccinocarboxamide synthase [Fimbriimonadaceae bacterium]|nr:phosphoribosylaminoimidazolesuccinocarboxamide synthase [Fimbriimonadaceae bacterium]